MVRRAVVALALLLAALAEPAAASRGLVITSRAPKGTETQRAIKFQQAMVRRVLNTLGCEYDVVPQSVVAATREGPAENLNQNALRTGLVRYGTGVSSYTRQYGWVVHLNFYPDGGGPTWTVGHRPDTLTLRTGVADGTDPLWPQIPQIFVGATAVTGGSLYGNIAACTTGVKSTGGMSTLVNHGAATSLRRVGSDLGWKVMPVSNSYIYHRNDANALVIDRATRDRIIRSRVIVGGSSGAGINNPKGASGESYPDSMSNPESGTSSPLADTALVYTQERFVGDTAAMVFMLAPTVTNSFIPQPHALFAMCVAIADSAAGGAIIGQRPGWQPPAMGVVVSGAFTHSVSNIGDNTEWNTHGTQVATIDDSQHLADGAEIIDNLGVPVLVTVNLDSVAAYPNEKPVWARIAKARFTPESRIGVGTTLVGAAVNANRYNSPDVLGYKRERAIITDDRYNNGTACDGSDTTLSCLLEYSRIRLDSIPEFHGRLSKTLVAPWGDYIPRQYRKGFTPGADSLHTAMVRAKFTTGIIQVIPDETMGSGSQFNSAGGLIARGDEAPSVPRPSAGRYRMGNGLGDFRWLAARHIDEANNGFVASHSISDEFMDGFFGSPWYIDDLVGWRHNFRTRLHVYFIKPGDMGFRATSTSNVSRHGLHELRWVVNQVKAINAFAGRTVIAFAYPEDIEP